MAVRSRRDLAGALRSDAGAMVAAVDLDHDLHLGPGERASQDLHAFGGVSADPQGDPLGKGTQPAAARSRGPQWVGDEQVGEARLGEDLRLTHGRQR